MGDNQLPEEFFRDIAVQTSDRIMAALPSEEELALRLTFSPGFDQKMRRLLANPNTARTQPRRAWRVLAVAAVIIILLVSALMSVSAMREAVFKFFTELYEKYIVVWYEPEADTLTAPETILEFREPGYIPPGYARDYEEKTELFHFVFYLNNDNQEIVFEQAPLDSRQFAIDIENEDKEKLFTINGATGMLRIKNGLQEVVWTDNEYSYKLSGTIDSEQAIMMAQSIK